MECMFTAQGPSVLHTIEVAVVQFAQVHLVYIYQFSNPLCSQRFNFGTGGGMYQVVQVHWEALLSHKAGSQSNCCVKSFSFSSDKLSSSGVV